MNEISVTISKSDYEPNSNHFIQTMFGAIQISKLTIVSKWSKSFDDETVLWKLAA